MVMRWVLSGTALLVVVALVLAGFWLADDKSPPLTTATTPTTTPTTTASPTSTTVTSATYPLPVSMCAIPMIARYQDHVVRLGDCAGLIGNMDKAAPISVPVGSTILINGTLEGELFGSDAAGPFYGPFVSSDPGIAEITSQTPSEVTVVAKAVGTTRVAASTQFSCVGGPSSDCTVTLITVTA